MPSATRTGSVALATLTIIALAGCSGGGTNLEGAGYVSGDGTTTVVEPADRVAAPELDGELVGGGSYDLGAERGDDLVVVNVWGSWCAPCRAEAPVLQEIATEYEAEGVQVLGINTRDTAANAERFVDRFGLTFPSLVDDGRLQARFADSLPVAAIPTTIIIDRQGRVAARVLDEVSYTELRDLVDEVLAEPDGDAAGVGGTA